MVWEGLSAEVLFEQSAGASRAVTGVRGHPWSGRVRDRGKEGKEGACV